MSMKDILKKIPLVRRWADDSPKIAVLRMDGLIGDGIARQDSFDFYGMSPLIETAF